MLISKKEIQKANPPFLLVSATGEWTLVSKIVELNNYFKLEVVESKYGRFNKRSFAINDAPFYVGADVWELEYGSVLMALGHPSLLEHPARKIWEKWLASLPNTT